MTEFPSRHGRQVTNRDATEQGFDLGFLFQSAAAKELTPSWFTVIDVSSLIRMNSF
jgi:hypothetical protein